MMSLETSTEMFDKKVVEIKIIVSSRRKLFSGNSICPTLHFGKNAINYNTEPYTRETEEIPIATETK